jgi:hypothetical protein
VKWTAGQVSIGAETILFVTFKEEPHANADISEAVPVVQSKGELVASGEQM